MLAFLRTFAAVVLALMFFFFVPLVFLVGVAAFSDTGPRPDSWLTVRLSGPILEYYGPATLRDLFDDPPPCLMEVTENLEKAAVDDRIVGVILRLENPAIGFGKLDEIRAGVRLVQAAGKPVYAHSSSFNESALYVGSECDSIFVTPNADVALLGRGVSIEHWRGALDKLEVEAELDVIDDYKSAAELFTRTESSPAALENIEWLIDEFESSYFRVLDKNRGLDEETLRDLRERALMRGEDLAAAGIVDGTRWWDELEDQLRGAHENLRTVSSQAYANVARESLKLGGKNRIAVIHAQGFVSSGGEDRYDPATGLNLGAGRVVDDLDAARRDDGIDAVILRWDTGGGETFGGEMIARAIERLRDEKPVVVSMADVAASAGYTMSFRAHRLICPRNGITGSIGSITGKFAVQGLAEKLGVTHTQIAYGPHSLIYSPFSSFSDAQWEVLRREHRRAYDDWVADIADARGVTPEDIYPLAGGRVWTGGQALEHGLVDGLGGFAAAVREVKALIDLDEGSKLSYEHYPARPTAADLLFSGDFLQLGTAELSRSLREAVVAQGSQGIQRIGWMPWRVR